MISKYRMFEEGSGILYSTSLKKIRDSDVPFQFSVFSSQIKRFRDFQHKIFRPISPT